QELEQEKLISEAANRAKSEFLATMSHELRTPLNAVLGLSEVLQEQLFGPLNAKQADYIHHIHNSGQHLLQLINDILDLAKVELGREVLSLAPVPVFDVCHYCLMLVQEQAFERGLHISSHIDPAAHTCLADERRLRQMLLNLLSNAIKFTPAGSVSLIVEKQPRSIVFTVADTGIGIAADQLPLLFKPFSQLDSQLDRKYSGTGLGLALTRNLAQLHGGKVTVESTLGKGSRFTIELPDSGQSESVDDANGEGDRLTSLGAQQHRNSGRILIVEDDAGSAMLLQDYLQVSGYQVEHLTGGIDFIQRVRSFKPNLILLDGQLPGEATGLDLVAHLRSQPDLYTIPVVAVTAMAMSGDRERFLQAGANAYLSKPIEIVQLESLLMKYL
ncbi:response regulator, partial [Leptolyngbya sp. FACHB-36]|uniref:ATP-binding response regulator n=1 Tax=Leptolyngbya sp. FACHB-36 TaxID=2692808 RepID=UPI001680536B